MSLYSLLGLDVCKQSRPVAETFCLRDGKLLSWKVQVGRFLNIGSPLSTEVTCGRMGFQYRRLRCKMKGDRLFGRRSSFLLPPYPPWEGPWQPWLSWVAPRSVYGWLDCGWTRGQIRSIGFCIWEFGAGIWHTGSAGGCSCKDNSVWSGHFLPCGPDTRAWERMWPPVLNTLALPIPIFVQTTVFCPWLLRYPICIMNTSFLLKPTSVFLSLAS